MEREDPEWEQYLPTATLAYNSKVHSATGFSPYYALMGREPRLPVDLLVRLPDEDALPIHDFVKGMRKRFLVMTEFLRANGEAQIERNSHGYEGDPEDWQPGTLVWYFLPRLVPGKPKKFTNQWMGPWEVIEKLAPVLVKIKPANSEGEERVVHTSRLRLYRREDGRMKTLPRSLEIDEDEDDEPTLLIPARTAVPRELGIPIQFGEPEAEMQDLPRAPVDPVLDVEMRPDPAQGAEVEDSVLRVLPSEDEDMQGAATAPPLSAEGTEASQPPSEIMDETGPTGPSQRSVPSDRRRPRSETSDTSEERQKPVQKRRSLFQRAKALTLSRRPAPPASSSTESTMEDEMMTLVPVQVPAQSAQMQRGTPGSAAWDLCSPVSCKLPAGRVTQINLQFRAAIPPGWYLQLVTRSSLAKQGIVVVGGVIDSDYRGDISVLLVNLGKEDFEVQEGDRVAAAIFLEHGEPVFSTVEELPTSQRAAGGFGSTGR